MRVEQTSRTRLRYKRARTTYGILGMIQYIQMNQLKSLGDLNFCTVRVADRLIYFC